MRTPGRYRYFVVAVFFAFMLLHQSDKLLIGPLTTPIMETFGIDEAEMGAVFTGALLVAALFYPLWGYLYDRFARARLLALASFIWGSTTWISAIAPTYPSFLVSRASTGIDDSSYPGLYSLVADYFGPGMRSKIYGLLQLTQPLGYLIGMVLALVVGEQIGWRGVFYLTGGLGVTLAVLIFFGVREVPRGRSEPELAELEEIGVYRFNWKAARGLLRKRTLLPLFLQGFSGVFPWNAISYWFFRYLQTERGYTQDEVLLTMSVAVLVLAFGYFFGGALGDYFFKRTRRGRLYVSLFGVLAGAVLLVFAVNVPVGEKGLFLVMLSLTALFMPLPSPNVVSTVYDIAEPEVRSTALAIQYFIENSGAALSPLLTGLLVSRLSLSLGSSILIICTTAWLISGAFFAVAAYLAPRDIEALRQTMRQRAAQAQAGLAGEAAPALDIARQPGA